MQNAETDRLHQLKPGQLWKVEHRFLYIVDLGKRLVWYKMLRHANARTAITQMISVESLLNYLRQTEAELAAEADSAMQTAVAA